MESGQAKVFNAAAASGKVAFEKIKSCFLMDDQERIGVDPGGNVIILDVDPMIQVLRAGELAAAQKYAATPQAGESPEALALRTIIIESANKAIAGRVFKENNERWTTVSREPTEAEKAAEQKRMAKMKILM